ncbi:hypothetical protein ACLB2K_059140 [Fragaria x ananassa]
MAFFPGSIVASCYSLIEGQKLLQQMVEKLALTKNRVVPEQRVGLATEDLPLRGGNIVRSQVLFSPYSTTELLRFSTESNPLLF